MKDDKLREKDWIETPAEWLRDAGYSGRHDLRPLAGGDINDTALLTTASGERFCIKQNRAAAPDFFAAEAAGLQALADTRTLRVPRVVFVSRYFLVLEYLPGGQKKTGYWEALGRGLAEMHRQPQELFGFQRDNYCGPTPQPNPPTPDGYTFYREHRIIYQAKLAFDNGRLQQQELSEVERFANRLAELVPIQRPALIHGDLWGGNIHVDNAGEPVLIDPAAYWGWPEAEIAMTRLFGGFAESFYQSYVETNPLEPEWRERATVYNVYHLLNHLNLFGGSYHSQAMSAVRQFT
ncbi:fructosamine kinase family protein [Proteobacteria bacterium 005FR1]|nr:fructosamine kinase family protein [Proteobacteria bacterium 005FR1]